MLYNPPHLYFQSKRQQGFTLIELLMVIAVILILAGITFSASRGVQNAQARAKTKAELATISQALETYRSKNGDYPWISVSDVSKDTQVKNAAHGVMKTLVGWQSVTGTQEGAADSQTGVIFQKQESTLDVSKLSLSQDWPDPKSDEETAPSLNTYFRDPWGNAYVYLYKNPSNSSKWERYGYILFSRGGDGAASSSGLDESTGEMVTYPAGSSFKEQTANIDNIIAGQ